MSSQKQRESRWPHRLAVALVCATFPLIWVGGLVTTYDAGMAVPDWPSTYGYNLFLYPWTTWLAGPWDLFIEHGHRLLGALVGLIALALTGVVWKCDERTWVRWLALGALALVIVQGVLGGARVVFDERQLAKLHGCLGPLFFAVATALAVCTSRVWRRGPLLGASRAATKLHRLTLLTAAFAYLQLVAGAHLRHVPVTAGASEFRAALHFHLLGAAAVTAHVVLAATHVARHFAAERALLRPAAALALLIVVQLALGAGAWLAKYALPIDAERVSWLRGFTIENEGMVQALTVTAHTAGGSLILALAVLLTLRAWRLAPALSRSDIPPTRAQEQGALETVA